MLWIITSLATSQWAIHLVLVILRGDSTGNSPEPSRTALPARVPHMLLGDRIHPWATTRHSAVHIMTQSHCCWLGQDLDICLKASNQNNRRASVALKQSSLHVCNWDLLTYMLNLCYKERKKLWPKGSSLGIPQGHRPTQPPKQLSKICSAWSIALLLEN